MNDDAVPLSSRLESAKRSYVTRHVDLAQCTQLITPSSLNSGDLLLARVNRIRQHTRIELVTGRRAHLYPQDELILVAGRRYASDQFEAELPHLGPAHLVAAGGIAAQVISRHAHSKPATEIDILSALGNSSGRVMNLREFAPLPSFTETAESSWPIRTLLVVGSGMNSGKTTLASNLVAVLSRQNHPVTACKLTGTGSGPDLWRFIDAGARTSCDFTDAGLAGTWQHPASDLVAIATRVRQRAQQDRHSYLIVELADGFLQQETNELLHCGAFRSLVDACFIAADCTPGAILLARQMAALDLPVLGISGTLTKAPLLCEEVKRATGLPVLNQEQLLSPESINVYLGAYGAAVR